MYRKTFGHLLTLRSQESPPAVEVYWLLKPQPRVLPPKLHRPLLQQKNQRSHPQKHLPCKHPHPKRRKRLARWQWISSKTLLRASTLHRRIARRIRPLPAEVEHAGLTLTKSE